MKKLLLGILLSFFLCGSAFAVPYSLNFDADAAGSNDLGNEIYGWDLESYNNGLTLDGVAVNTIVHQTLAGFDPSSNTVINNDGILNNGDWFREDISLQLLNGVDAVGNNNTTNTLGQDYDWYSDLYLNVHLEGYITNYSSGGPGDTTAANPDGVKDDTFLTIFALGSAELFVDGDGDFVYDGGTNDTRVAGFDFVNAAPSLFVPSVFSGQGASANINVQFEFIYANDDYWSTVTSPPTMQDLVGQRFLLAFAEGNVAVDALTGDEAADPDEILFGVNDTGFDARFEVVPEPGTILLLGFGLLGIAGIGRKRINL